MQGEMGSQEIPSRNSSPALSQATGAAGNVVLGHLDWRLHPPQPFLPAFAAARSHAAWISPELGSRDILTAPWGRPGATQILALAGAAAGKSGREQLLEQEHPREIRGKY